jgi:hypothetical protein
LDTKTVKLFSPTCSLISENIVDFCEGEEERRGEERGGEERRGVERRGELKHSGKNGYHCHITQHKSNMG